MRTGESRRRETNEPNVVNLPLPGRALGEELLVVLSLSLLASAVFAVISIATAPIEGVRVASANQDPLLVRQVAEFVFGLAPVWLVVYLVRRNGEGVRAIGLAWDRPGPDSALGAGLFAVLGVAGVALYWATIELGVNRVVVPAPPLGHWWTIPVLVLAAVQAALLEEIIVVGYLITRLRQLRWTPLAAVGASALLRGTYHLYQGWGGFLGNLALGALFGLLFVRTHRTWPLVIAHFLIDVGAGVGYVLLVTHLDFI